MSLGISKITDLEELREIARLVLTENEQLHGRLGSILDFFGKAKQDLRHALGSGSTTNSIVANLGADVLIPGTRW